jgi:hypothetical protein
LPGKRTTSALARKRCAAGSAFPNDHQEADCQSRLRAAPADRRRRTTLDQAKLANAYEELSAEREKQNSRPPKTKKASLMLRLLHRSGPTYSIG